MARSRYDDDEDDRPRRRPRGDDDDDEDERPRGRSKRASEDDDDDVPRRKAGNGLATASLIFGILSFCTGITFIPGLICGFMGLSKSKSTGSGKGVAIAGLLTSVAGIFVSGAMAFGGYFLYSKAEENKDRMRTHNNFKQAGIASHSYSDANGKLPKPYIDDASGGFGRAPLPSEVSSKLSWRVAILPYVEQGSLFNQFDLRSPWDGPKNKPLSQTVVSAYRDADTPLDPTTRIRCFYGNGALFDLEKSFQLYSITDGTSNTIMFVEGADKVTWSQFNEYKFDPKGPLPTLGHPKRDTFIVGLADGSVRSVRKTVNPETIKAAITRDGGEVMGFDW